MNINNIKNNIFTFLKKYSTIILCVICFLAANIHLISYLYPTDSPIIGHDYQYHYLRVEAVKYNIENGLFSGIDYFYFGGGGYASFAYPDIFLYIPALLRIFGAGIGESMAFFLCLCNALSYCFMFSFMRNISKSSVCATIGAVLYVLSTYRIDNIITRFALGEVLAYVFWPLILYGLYDFIFGEFKKPYIIGIGFVGMLLSHTISTALALGLCVVVSVIFVRRILKREKLLKLAVTAGSAVAVTAFYWLPLLELLFSCEMSVAKSAFNTVDYVIPFVGLFKEIVHNGIAGMKFPIFLLCAPRLFLTRESPVSRKLRHVKTKKRKDILIFADTSAIIGLVLAIMSTNLVPWEYLSLVLNFMQFPWRFFAPASILLITAGTVYVFCIAEYTRVAKPAMLFITAAALLIAFVHVYIAGINHTEPYEADHYYSDVNETYHVGMGEWLPRAANAHGKDIVRSMGDTVLLSNTESVPCDRHNGTLTFELTESYGVYFATLPYIWYKGYEAADENGKELDISMSDNGLVQVDLRGAKGRITVTHHPTVIRIISCFISAFSIISAAIIMIISRARRRKKTG